MEMAKRQKLMTTADVGEAAGQATTATMEGGTAQGPSDQLPTYLLLVLRGLEFLVLEDIKKNLEVVYIELCSKEKDEENPNINLFQGDAAVGRIVLQTTSSPERVRALNSVQAILALVAKSNEIVTDDVKGITQIAEMVAAADWTQPLSLWHAHMNIIFPGKYPADHQPSFRGSCVRDGRHAYSSVAIAAEMGGAINRKFGWPVSLTKFELEVACLIFYKHMVVGISLTDPTKLQFRNRMIHEDRSILADSDYISTLRPSTTYLLLKLAEYEVGDVLLDSLCGVGTIPVCAAEFSNNTVYALGGELDTTPVQKAGANAAAKPRAVNVCQWDSTNLPLRDATVDKIVIDLPFGVSCGTPRHLSKIYPRIMKELYRVLRPGGRAVLLSGLKKTFEHSVPLQPWTLTASYNVNIGGLLAAVYVVDKE